jgi:outer membrane protein TolC
LARSSTDARRSYSQRNAVRTPIGVAEKKSDVAQENLKLTRQRYEAGVTDNVEVVQAQDAVASAELDYINNLFAHNIAKLSLARAIGVAADRYSAFLGTN